jgi:hypothetical protein
LLRGIPNWQELLYNNVLLALVWAADTMYDNIDQVYDE